MMMRRRQRGSSLIELTLLAPWIWFLFVGIFNLGFYSYALISVENAARVAAEYTSGDPSVAADQTTACTLIRQELVNLPNVTGLSNCDATPLTVKATSGPGPDGSLASSVAVTYQGVQLIPIPGLLTGRLAVTRTVQMRVKS